MAHEAYIVAELEDAGDAPSYCVSCEWKGPASEADSAWGCCLTPGGMVPAGRCPCCGESVYIEVEAEPVRIVIGLDGGIVQGITANTPIEYLVYDYDIEGSDRVVTRPALDGGDVEVIDSGCDEAVVDAKVIATIYAAIEAEGEEIIPEDLPCPGI